MPYELPAVGEQRAYDRMMVDRCNGLLEEDGHGNYDHRCIHSQGDYLAELIGLTDYPSFDVEQLKQLFFEWEHHKEQGIMSFRNNSYKSVVTGKMAPLLYGPDGKTVLDWNTIGRMQCPTRARALGWRICLMGMCASRVHDINVSYVLK